MMEAVEYSPDERYARYPEELGQGAYKTVYKAFDTNDALEVAWNKLHVDRLPAAEVAKVETEVALLRAVSHRNIINLYAFWREPRPDGRPASMDFITELMSSGTLKQYLKRSKSIKLRVIRRWCANLLDAIAYLHARSPPIMHRDLKCDNIFINGHLGEVRHRGGVGREVGGEVGAKGPVGPSDVGQPMLPGLAGLYSLCCVKRRVSHTVLTGWTIVFASPCVSGCWSWCGAGEAGRPGIVTGQVSDVGVVVHWHARVHGARTV